MNTFSELNIPAKVNDYLGEKIKVKTLLNQQIKVIKFKIEPSKIEDFGRECLTVQIEKNGELRLIFSGSVFLIDQIKRVPEDKFPFMTVIKEENGHYEFT